MFQQFTQRRRGAVPRKGAAIVLALLLNLAILPCAMALETPDTEHDCCPPTLELQQLECCEFDDVSVDHRDSKKPNPVVLSVSDEQPLQPAIRTVLRRVPIPPDCSGSSPPIYVLNCVYLK
jgi:hypothetical protein